MYIRTVVSRGIVDFEETISNLGRVDNTDEDTKILECNHFNIPMSRRLPISEQDVSLEAPKRKKKFGLRAENDLALA